MIRPWRTVDSVDTDEGLLDLRQRGETDFLITIDGRVLMNSTANMSEIVLAELACESLKNKKNPFRDANGKKMMRLYVEKVK